MKTLGSLCLLVGFLSGAYFVVAQAHAIDWLYYGIGAAFMVAGIGLMHVARGRAAAGSEQHDEDLDVLEASLESLGARVESFAAVEADEDLLGMHTRIDAELLDDINAFVEVRESMIPRLGMQPYADIMSPFATGERLLNRAWSASVDGYVDEVRVCVKEAASELRSAQARLREARAALHV